MRHKEIKELAQGDVSSQWWRWKSYPGSLAPKSSFLPTLLYQLFTLGDSCRAAVRNIFAPRDQFRGRQWVHGQQWGGWGMLQAVM